MEILKKLIVPEHKYCNVCEQDFKKAHQEILQWHEEKIKEARAHQEIDTTHKMKRWIAKKLPKEMYDPKKSCQPDYPDDYTKGEVKGHNACLDKVRKELGL